MTCYGVNCTSVCANNTAIIEYPNCHSVLSKYKLKPFRIKINFFLTYNDFIASDNIKDLGKRKLNVKKQIRSYIIIAFSSFRSLISPEKSYIPLMRQINCYN